MPSTDQGSPKDATRGARTRKALDRRRKRRGVSRCTIREARYGSERHPVAAEGAAEPRGAALRATRRACSR